MVIASHKKKKKNMNKNAITQHPVIKKFIKKSQKKRIKKKLFKVI